MKFSIKNITYGLAACLAATALTGCADDDFRLPDSDATRTDAQLVISIPIPRGNEPRTDADTRADGDDGVNAQSNSDPTFPVSDTEAYIGSLRLLAFDTNNGNAIAFNKPLTVPSEMQGVNASTAVANYEIKDIKEGTYKFYVIANYDDPQVWDVADEDDLKAVLIDYDNKRPVAGNLPMVYDPGATVITIAKPGTGVTQTIDAELKINAVKVTYNLIFDKDNLTDDDSKECAKNFGKYGLKITEVKVNGIPKGAHLINQVTDENAIPDSYTEFETYDCPDDFRGSYYTDWDKTPTNASVSDKTVINTKGTSTSHGSFTNYNGKWLMQGTIYLPEHYVKNGTETAMTIKGKLTDGTNVTSIPVDYTINLAAHDENPIAKSMPRNTFYEVIGTITQSGNTQIDALVYAKDWAESVMNVDFVTTYLQLDKVNARVESLSGDEINYSTDARGGAYLECKTTLLDKPVVIAETDPTRPGVLSLKVNPEINVQTLMDQSLNTSGTAECYIVAGNLRKKITVEFDITPFFTIEPLDVFLQWTDDEAKPKSSFKWSTNLGGLYLKYKNGTTLQEINIGSGGNIISKTIDNKDVEINLTCANQGAASGTFSVESQNAPVTTTIFEFEAYGALAKTNPTYQASQYMANLTVRVKPKLGGYRIYFRAINDYMKATNWSNGVRGAESWLNGENSVSSELYPKEYYGTEKENLNWSDWWYCKWDNETRIKKQADEDNHRIYIWEQEGETVGKNPMLKAWYYTSGGYNDSPKMTADYANPGWYYYDVPFNMESLSCANGASGTRNIKPGSALIIIHGHEDGVYLHRVTHNCDAGIPLFNYEDREGWILYDPTTTPYYKVFDDKPIIEDIEYKIWVNYDGDSPNNNDEAPYEFYVNYGVADGESLTNKFTLKSTNIHWGDSKEAGGIKWKEYKIRMKAPRGQYAKSINLKFNKVAASAAVTKPLPTTKQAAYIKNPNFTPHIHIWSGLSNATTWPGPEMHKYIVGGDTYYWYEIPSGYSNGTIQINNGTNSTQLQNVLGEKSMIYENGSYRELTETSFTYSPSMGAHDLVIFGGRNWTEGTLNRNTGIWSQGSPDKYYK